MRLKHHYPVRQVNTMEYILKFHNPVPLCQPNIPIEKAKSMTFAMSDVSFRSAFDNGMDCKRCADRISYSDQLSATITLRGIELNGRRMLSGVRRKA